MNDMRKPLKDNVEMLTIDELEGKMAGGLHFANMLGFTNQEKAKNTSALLHAVIELLITKGVIHLHEIEKRKEKLLSSLNESDVSGPQVKLTDTPDKYTYEGVINVDCASRRHLCKGICCKLWFALSVQDLDEQIVKWNYTQPYSISQSSDARCIHQDHCNLQCTIYENRPLICRTYDCSTDKRVWLDFDKRIINPEMFAKKGLQPATPANAKIEIPG
ncbi:MAG: YkgJ family cysteine cluster protein [Desulfobulbaceae bacterium]|nr:YkgJ family cysteine cluster protein [Desulfobulbaceae bacterium]